LHDEGKSIMNDDRCYPDMLKVYARERGKRISLLWFRAKIRLLFYAWLPIRFKILLRRLV
jgi:hypothetical protein